MPGVACKGTKVSRKHSLEDYKGPKRTKVPLNQGFFFWGGGVGFRVKGSQGVGIRCFFSGSGIGLYSAL